MSSNASYGRACFTFDSGEPPQIRQTWNLGNEFEINGYKRKIVSSRAVQVDSHLLPFPELQPDPSIARSYEFTIRSLGLTVRWNVGASLARAQDAGGTGFVDCIGYLSGEVGITTIHTVMCRGLPGQKFRVTFYEVSVLLESNWQMHWDLPSP